MAFIDYGALLVKNGKVVNKDETFMNMQNAVGWTDVIDKKSSETIDGNSFVYLGDEELTLAFYKTFIEIVVNKERYGEVWQLNFKKHEDRYKQTNYDKRVLRLNIGQTNIKIKKLTDVVYHLSVKYKGNFYHVFYGYGIDTKEKIWNSCKAKYLGNKTARRVDNLYRRYIKSW